VRLRAVGGAGGTVELCFRRRESGVGSGGCGGLCRRVHSVCHGDGVGVFRLTNVVVGEMKREGCFKKKRMRKKRWFFFFFFFFWLC